MMLNYEFSPATWAERTREIRQKWNRNETIGLVTINFLIVNSSKIND